MSADPNASAAAGGGGIDNNSKSVTVIAMRIPFNLQSLFSLGALSSNQQEADLFSGSFDDGSSPFGDGMMPPFLGNGEPIDVDINPFDFLSAIQIGSTSLEDPDWSTSQSVTMDLSSNRMITDEDVRAGQILDSEDTLDLILVSAIPFTG